MYFFRILASIIYFSIIMQLVVQCISTDVLLKHSLHCRLTLRKWWLGLLLNCGIHSHQSAPLESSCCIDILCPLSQALLRRFLGFYFLLYRILSFFLYLFRKDTLVHICKRKTLAQDWNLSYRLCMQALCSLAGCPQTRETNGMLPS